MQAAEAEEDKEEEEPELPATHSNGQLEHGKGDTAKGKWFKVCLSTVGITASLTPHVPRASHLMKLLGCPLSVCGVCLCVCGERG